MVGARQRAVMTTAAVARKLPSSEASAPRRDRRSRRKFVVRPRKLVATVGFICALFLILGTRQAAITAMGYQIDATRQQLAGLDAERAALEGRLASFATPGMIEQKALAMGMTDPGDPIVVQVASLEPVRESPNERTATVVVALPTEEGNAPAAPFAEAQDGAVARVGAWLYSWLTGGQVQAETLHEPE